MKNKFDSAWEALINAQRKPVARRKTHFAAGDQILSYGKPCAAAYRILRGRVHIFDPDNDKTYKVSPGDFLGFMSLLLAGKGVCDAIALEDCWVEVFTYQELQDLLKQDCEEADRLCYQLFRASWVSFTNFKLRKSFH